VRTLSEHHQFTISIITRYEILRGLKAADIYADLYKRLVRQISSIFGLKSSELIEFIQRLVSSKDGEALIAVMRGKVPQIKI
jgi:hypothetical protein